MGQAQKIYLNQNKQQNKNKKRRRKEGKRNILILVDF